MTIKEILERIPTANDRNYWMVRTNGGDYYDSFLSGEFIAIGWDEITLENIKNAHIHKEAGVNQLADKVSSVYDDEARPGHVAKQLLKFTYEIKKGDIVLVPSYSSDRIAFVEVLDSMAYNEHDGTYECPHIKRKKIKLLRIVEKYRLDPNLYKIFFSRGTITDANGYAAYIDKIINGLFIKGQDAHFVLEVETTEEVKARQLFKLGDLALDIFEEFCQEEGLDYDADEFDIKLAVQSPGFIEIIGAIAGITILGIILVAIAGGGFEVKYKKDFSASIKTDGIIERVRNFIFTKSNAKAKKEIVDKALKEMKIKTPDELLKIIEELNKK